MLLWITNPSVSIISFAPVELCKDPIQFPDGMFSCYSEYISHDSVSTVCIFKMHCKVHRILLECTSATHRPQSLYLNSIHFWMWSVQTVGSPNLAKLSEAGPKPNCAKPWQHYYLVVFPWSSPVNLDVNHRLMVPLESPVVNLLRLLSIDQAIAYRYIYSGRCMLAPIKITYLKWNCG